MAGTRGGENVSIGVIEPTGGGELKAVKALAKRGSRTLGLVPFAAYDEAAARGWIAVARHGSDIVGFAFFRVTKKWVALAQLYVDTDWRRQGIARALVDWISERYRGRPGIRVTCRQDYGLAAAWSAMGFARAGEIPGRGRDRKPLVVWWRDHQHPRLFDWNRPDVQVRASIDFNVLRDLEDVRRPGHLEALALTDDQLAGRLRLVRTGELDVELDGLGDAESRDRCARLERDLEPSAAPSHLLGPLEAELLAAIPPSFSADPRGRRDVRYVSEAIVSGVDVFITQDRELERVVGPWAAERGVRILTPSDAVVHLDELADARAYQPASVGDTSYRVQRLGAGSDERLLAFASTRSAESEAQLRRRIKDLTARGVARYGTSAPDGPLVAAYLAAAGATALEVPMLRAADDALADTLLRQLLFRFRSEARELRLQAIRLTDPHLDPAARAAALDDGFLAADNGLVALVVDVCGPASAVSEAACAAARAVGIPEPASVRTAAAEVAALAERAWWPAKVADSPLPTYLVPIRQPYSTPLLGYPAGIFARDDLLGLRREHVYYRSARGIRPVAPARILWYASGTGARAPVPAGVIACSSLDEVVEGEPGALHERFRHLGVWRREQVIRAAEGDGVAQALHFSGTEVFPIAVTLKRMRELGVPHPMGPRKVDPAVFAALYREGRRVG